MLWPAETFILKKAFGIKVVLTPEIIMIAKSAGYHSLFIDIEHTTLSLKDVSALNMTALGVGITPFVRVPWQCGNGFIQRVLDSGAMGVVFPHISTVGESDMLCESVLEIIPTVLDRGGLS